MCRRFTSIRLTCREGEIASGESSAYISLGPSHTEQPFLRISLPRRGMRKGFVHLHERGNMEMTWTSFTDCERVLIIEQHD